MIKMRIAGVGINPMMTHRVVILEEKGGGDAVKRCLPILIGPAEADAIMIKLQGVTVGRPLTHDLIRSVIDALGATVKCIIVSDLKEDIFYAKIILNVAGEQIRIDSRPSDALALAVRADVPIYAEQAILDTAGILLDKEMGKPVPPETSQGGGKRVSQEELRRMSAFRDFVESFDLDDLDKRKP